MTSNKSGVVQQGRERMTYRIANYPVDLGFSVEQVRPVETKRFLEGNLARGGGFGNRRIGKLATLTKRKEARRQPDVAHGNGHKISGSPGNLQEAQAVGNRFRLRCDFDGVHLAMPRDENVAGKGRRALEVVDRKHDAWRHGIGAQKTFRQLAEGFHLDIAPLATSFAGLAEPIELACNVASVLSAALFAAAGGEKCGLWRTVRFQPAYQPRALRIALQPVKTQLDGPGASRSTAYLPGHFSSRSSRRNGANLPYTFAKECHPRP